mgnify:CR=1
MSCDGSKLTTTRLDSRSLIDARRGRWRQKLFYILDFNFLFHVSFTAKNKKSPLKD